MVGRGVLPKSYFDENPISPTRRSPAGMASTCHEVQGCGDDADYCSVEWLATVDILSISGFVLWTLMVRRRLYREVEISRVKSVGRE
jgi:hypothetical protein